MKPAPFDYQKPDTLEDLFSRLESHGEAAVILAGGQSLMPALNMRLDAPGVVIDINGLDELSGISTDGDNLKIGALTRHHAIETSAEIAEKAPLLALAAPHIAHPAIRNRGTIGGSIALCDPAAEWPACLLALDAEIEIAGSAGRRQVRAADFFKGLYETDLEPAEIVTAIRVPVADKSHVFAFEELARRHGDYALAGLALRGRKEKNTLADTRIAFFGIQDTAVLAPKAAEHLSAAPLDETVISRACEALDQDLEPVGDINCSAEAKRYYAGELLARGLRALSA